MGDKRDSQRQHVLKAGTILFDGSGIDCLVRKMSLGGANLEVESQTGIPNSFDLVIDVEHSNHHCHLIWRKARRIGVREGDYGCVTDFLAYSILKVRLS